jgi:hypothetical protein
MTNNFQQGRTINRVPRVRRESGDAFGFYSHEIMLDLRLGTIALFFTYSEHEGEEKSYQNNLEIFVPIKNLPLPLAEVTA